MANKKKVWKKMFPLICKLRKAASTYSLLPSFYGTIDLEYVNDSGEGEMERVAG